MYSKFTAIALLCLFPALVKTSASPITYTIALKVDTVFLIHPPQGYPSVTFSPIPGIGDIYYGSFTLDDAILSGDGLKTDAALSAFSLEIGGIVWDMNDPASVFHGFRNPWGFADVPAFLVNGGQVVSVGGGVYAEGDAPFADFFTDGRFSAIDLGCTAIRGSMAVGTVPEPSAFSSTLVGLLGLAGLRLKRRVV